MNLKEVIRKNTPQTINIDEFGLNAWSEVGRSQRGNFALVQDWRRTSDTAVEVRLRFLGIPGAHPWTFLWNTQRRATMVINGTSHNGPLINTGGNSNHLTSLVLMTFSFNTSNRSFTLGNASYDFPSVNLPATTDPNGSRSVWTASNNGTISRPNPLNVTWAPPQPEGRVFVKRNGAWVRIRTFARRNGVYHETSTWARSGGSWRQ